MAAVARAVVRMADTLNVCSELLQQRSLCATKAMIVGLEDDSDPTYTHFTHRVEFLELLHRYLGTDLLREPADNEDEGEERLVRQMGAILDHYLPLPGLLDPSLSDIVTPLMELLWTALSRLSDHESGVSAKRLRRLGSVINWVVKVRGWKAVIPQFPSSIHHLPILVALLSPPTSPSSSTTPDTPHHPFISGEDAWELRAVLLLWLSLLLTVPFNLSALSSETTPSPTVDLPSLRLLFPTPISSLAQQSILLSLPFLHRPGKEGAYAALVLARIYSRSDAVDHLPGFSAWAEQELREGDRENEANFVASLFVFLSILPSLIAPAHFDSLASFTSSALLHHLRGTQTAASSGLIRKLAVKARGRWWIAKLGTLGGTPDDMPEGLEEELDNFMNGLSDKDTIVRYSCAKYLARISALLPEAFSEQIVAATIGLFAGTEDQPVIETPFGLVIDPGGTASSEGTMSFGGAEIVKGEARWHGCCLAIAELARRGLVKGDEIVEQAVEWVLKALTFDLRRASHSVGANVRDAAAYLVWSLSRACPPKTFEPFAESIATALVAVACFDREVGVRRAASAAFQEGVGRLGLFPAGIDVLAKTDFYSVSVRRTAFTVAAHGVAIHAVYRNRMREHLHSITLRHWDNAMRHLGAAALQVMLKLGTDADLSDSLDRELAELGSLDAVNVHGGLVALVQIAELLSPEDEKRQRIIHAIGSIRPAALVSPQGMDVIQSACDLLTTCLSATIIEHSISDQVFGHYFDLALLRKESECHEAAARMLGRMSELRDVTTEVNKLLLGVNSPRASVKQMSALSLGTIQYKQRSKALFQAVGVLIGSLEPGSKADVETRRYATRSLAMLVHQVDDSGEVLLGPIPFQSVLSAFIRALTDYTTDQRGDVGSWIRVAGLTALGESIVLASRHSESLVLISQARFEEVISGMIKQGGEKLEPVRAAVWRSWRSMQSAAVGGIWEWEGGEIWNFAVENDSDESFRYIELRQWYHSAMPLLKTKYRSSFVSGFLHSAGSQVGSLATEALEALQTYILSLPGTDNPLSSIIRDVQDILLDNLNQNRVFIPAISMTTRIASSAQLRTLLQDHSDQRSPIRDIIPLSCRGVPQIKSIERITGVMRLIIACIHFTESGIRDKAAGTLPLFLSHRFPRIRAMTSEALYLALSETQDEIDTELESLLLETSWADAESGEAEAKRVVEILQSQLE